MTDVVRPLTALNSFVLDEAGVYRLDLVPNVQTRYSDGSANEQAVMDSIKSAVDISSGSPELERAWSNWAQEAHLSPYRINLVAGLEWRESGRVLEIGCGCGALTRFLGERGLHVDALDVSAQRAAIARERCRNLNNVSVFCGNLNDLALPDSGYDHILLVGVLEYTARFSSENNKPVEQLIRETLQRCLSAITSEGTIFIAIENRLGFKYIAGAREDHYGVPRVGLYHYPAYMSEWSQKKSGIYTLDYQQWQQLLQSISGTHYRFFFPFPDYKLPEVILDAEFAQQDPYSYQILYRLRSRDYCADWSPPLDEYLYWQVATQCGQLNKTANSFGILLGRKPDTIRAAMPYDFIRFANLKRKRKYRISTFKLRRQDCVFKRYASEQNLDKPSSVIGHKLRTSDYIRGKLLSDIWVEALSSLAEIKILTDLLDEYYRFLTARSKRGILKNTDIDLIVFNLIVDDDQQWRVIDIEWEWIDGRDITVDFLLFRSLLYFSYVHGDAVANCFSNNAVVSVGDFVEFGFQYLNLELAGNREHYHCMENDFQSAVINDSAFQSVDAIWHQPLALAQRTGLPVSSIQVYWRLYNQVFSAGNSVSREFKVRPGRIERSIELPKLTANLAELRIDPVDHRLSAGYRIMKILKLNLRGDHGNYNWVTPNDILEHTRVSGMSLIDTHGDEWFVSSVDPQIIIDRKELSRLGRICTIDIEICWPNRCFQDVIELRLREENDKLMQLL